MVTATARQRLLEAADDLFYRVGVQTVGIDRVIEQAGVAKASLYNTFGSKEALVEAYLDGRRERLTAQIMRHVSAQEDPRARILAVFEALAEIVREPGYRGCAFALASAEAPSDGRVIHAAAGYRAWVRTLLTDLTSTLDVADPQLVARQLHLLYDGTSQAVRMDRNLAAADEARVVASLLLDASVA
ncbi:TetR/AcrR family transcriptional regulator [Cellulomonas sp. URHE0023]|uniref:TetR/AcrR family transcriptional regulator n=1 Tax=Cellulomonas sp. URHE0023 TaxID=1380354 RepID=UPI0005588789|nr:TetR/AcrR family transcriptional regulator [Cellulomonas sp. URHE0023]